MSFGNSSFLPLRFNFSTTQCEGQLIAKFTTPAEVPNGEADILWQCAGLAPYCYQANITNGTSDPTMQLDREAQVGCINEVLRTTSVLVVKTMSTRTTIETAVSIFTWTTTSFPRSQETSPTVTLPSQSWVTSGVVTPSSTLMNKDPTGTDTTAARAPTADSVRVEIPRSDMIGRTVRTTSPLPVTTDTVFDSGASKVTTPLVSSAVTTFLTTTLLRTVTDVITGSSDPRQSPSSSLKLVLEQANAGSSNTCRAIHGLWNQDVKEVTSRMYLVEASLSASQDEMARCDKQHEEDMHKLRTKVQELRAELHRTRELLHQITGDMQVLKDNESPGLVEVANSSEGSDSASSPATPEAIDAWATK
ncbi:hypothetical protein H633G_11236 [Metarhizium anisopliae BRIP 53284]|nr:hypothetical protein H633G_11236 [Metarhizium anisopliae BRIP 53284]